MNRRVAYNSIESWKKHGYSLHAIKEWRQVEHDAGRPSGLDDFYRAHRLCVACRSAGKKLVGVRWQDAKGSEQSSSLGTETEPIAIASLHERYLKYAVEWQYVYEPCEACGGTGMTLEP